MKICLVHFLIRNDQDRQNQNFFEGYGPRKSVMIKKKCHHSHPRHNENCIIKAINS